MLIKDAFTTVLEILEKKFGTISNQEDLIKTIKSLPSQKFNTTTAVQVTQYMSESQRCDITLIASNDHAKFVDELGRVLARLSEIHARNCQDCDQISAAHDMLAMFLNQYLFQDTSGSTPVNLPGSSSVIVITISIRPHRGTSTKKSSEHGRKLSGDQLRNRVKDWKITGK